MPSNGEGPVSDSDDNCVICMDAMVKNQDLLQIRGCSHIFHHHCLEKWIKEKIVDPSCPLCNLKMSWVKGGQI